MATDAEKLKQEIAEQLCDAGCVADGYEENDATRKAGYLLPWLQRLLTRERLKARLSMCDDILASASPLTWEELAKKLYDVRAVIQAKRGFVIRELAALDAGVERG